VERNKVLPVLCSAIKPTIRGGQNSVIVTKIFNDDDRFSYFHVGVALLFFCVGTVPKFSGKN